MPVPPPDPSTNPRTRGKQNPAVNKGFIRGLDSEQQNNAKLMVKIGKQQNLSDRDIAIAIMTSMDESSLHNLKGGDRDSAGLFQQRPSQGWGTFEQVTDPNYAITTFFKHLQAIGSRDKIQPWLAAQKVQNSAYADGSNYEKFWDQNSNGFQTNALQIAQYFIGGGPIDSSGKWPPPPGSLTTGGNLQLTDPTILDDLGNMGNDAWNAGQDIWGVITGWEKAVEVIGAFFGSLLWIFNVDHFLKFLLYTFGVIAVGIGLGLITFGTGSGEAETA